MLYIRIIYLHCYNIIVIYTYLLRRNNKNNNTIITLCKQFVFRQLIFGHPQCRLAHALNVNLCVRCLHTYIITGYIIAIRIIIYIYYNMIEVRNPQDVDYINMVGIYSDKAEHRRVYGFLYYLVFCFNTLTHTYIYIIFFL